MIAKYELTVWVTRTVDVEDDSAYYVDNAAKSQLERELLRAVRVMDGDFDCDVMSAVIVGETE